VPLYITADRKRFVPEGDPDAAFGVAPVDVDRLGLREALDAFLNPPVQPEPEAPKQAKQHADKAVRVHQDK
jgi:hypothetical protein